MSYMQILCLYLIIAKKHHQINNLSLVLRPAVDSQQTTANYAHLTQQPTNYS
jgi:hypothetical protein